MICFDFSCLVEDVLYKGVLLYFVVEVIVLCSCWYWCDVYVVYVECIWCLLWQLLMWQYCVFNGGLYQSFVIFDEVLIVLCGQSGWYIVEFKDIEDGGGYYFEFSYKFDVSQLLWLMQIGLQLGFVFSIEQWCNFVFDFSLK